VSELDLLVLDKYFPGKEKDLSFLGVDFHNWVNVVCTGSGGQFRLFLDNRLVFQSPCPQTPWPSRGSISASRHRQDKGCEPGQWNLISIWRYQWPAIF